MSKLKAPFSYFGGKSKVASLIWQHFGNLTNYVEPFAGSLAVLLANPSIPKIETVNEINPFISNFWRAVAYNAEEVSKYADYPVHETELHARHQFLLQAATEDFKNKLHNDVSYYDAKMAGYWVWGMGASVGSNWLQSKGLKALPLLSSAGGGIHGLNGNVYKWMHALQQRLKRVRVINGDWKRVVTPSVTYNNVGLSNKDITGVFLDPPYESSVRDKVYIDDNNIFNEVVKWAIDNGNNPKMRIILCGYSNDNNHNIPETWKVISWKSNGGLSSLGDSRGKDNANKETIWLSPHCL